ncbi:GNAT family N-acetyltransferase [Flavobacterium cerinum]|uniref:GNAT family N-acetyltransferase n=1 Tax=Flavobacterium cerinum TaxID=2502784 RepID=A0ABY5ISJ7_9FLAO|nr:GNAT family N-acetyltransferase [Flavobacterium cerinum]UUC44507.1 GNAT family N-acetyltransferase [Flavobacterium cerinum]
MKTTIYTPSVNDYIEITEVWEASVRATHTFLTEEDIQYYKPLILNEYLKAVTLFCTSDNGAITGFIGLSEDTIEMLFIRPDYRGKGVGKVLLDFAIKEHNVFKVDVNEQNEQAVGFYEYLGFKTVKREPLDPNGKPFPILSMELQK